MNDAKNVADDLNEEKLKQTEPIGGFASKR